MKLSVQKTFNLLTTSAAIALSVMLGSNNANASTFQSVKPKNQNQPQQLWSNQDTWTVTVRTANTVNLVPGPDDEVIITDDCDVIADGDIVITRLTVQAAAAGNKTTSFDLNGFTLALDYITLAGGSNSGGAANKRVVFNLNGGIVEVSGTAADYVITDPNNVEVNLGLKNGQPGQFVFLGLDPLPVELVSFAAVKKAGEVALTWETASEKNNAGFEVQLSADGKNYEALAFVASHNGNSSAAQHYAYSHKTANKEGLVYYRLKQTDLNGESEYYTAKVVDLARFNATVNTFPNPFQNRFELNLTAAATETASIQVIDMAGKTVYQADQKLQKGANTLNVELSNQPAGLYLLKATAGNQTYTNRLLKH